MPKFYIHQLNNGKMLVFEDNMFKIEETGYPYPDCAFPLGTKIESNQEKILELILGYPIENPLEFVKVVSTFKPMSLEDFKLKIQSENIGKGCPERLQTIANTIINGESWEIAFLMSIFPKYMLKPNLSIPDEFVEKYKSLLYYEWKLFENRHNSIFKNNILMFLGIGKITDLHLNFVKDLYEHFLNDSYKDLYKYLSVIKNEHEKGCIVLIDSTIGDTDIEYFYSKIAGLNLRDGYIDIQIDEEKFEASFVCTESYRENYYKEKKSIRGSIERMNL